MSPVLQAACVRCVSVRPKIKCVRELLPLCECACAPIRTCVCAYVCVCLATGTAIKIPLPHCNCKTSLRLICCVNSVTFRHLRMSLCICVCVCLYVYAFLPATGECNFSHTGLGLPYFHSFPLPRFRFLVVFLSIPIILAWRHPVACVSALYAVYLSTPAHCCPINCCTCVRATSVSDRCLPSRPMAKAVALACFLLVAYYYYFLLASLKLLTLTRTPTLSKLAGFFFTHCQISLAHMRSIAMNVCVFVCLGGVCSSYFV